MLGGQIGTAILPGIGTIAFGLAGAMAGAMLLPSYTNTAIGAIGDKYKYDIDHKTCESCEKPIIIRKYKDENETNAQDPSHADCKKKVSFADDGANLDANNLKHKL